MLGNRPRSPNGSWLWCASSSAPAKGVTPSQPGDINSQSVKGGDTVGGSRGYDAGKTVNGRKRSIAADPLALLLVAVICAASIQDRDGAKSVPLGAYVT